MSSTRRKLSWWAALWYMVSGRLASDINHLAAQAGPLEERVTELMRKQSDMERELGGKLGRIEQGLGVVTQEVVGLRESLAAKNAETPVDLSDELATAERIEQMLGGLTGGGEGQSSTSGASGLDLGSEPVRSTDASIEEEGQGASASGVLVSDGSEESGPGPASGGGQQF